MDAMKTVRIIARKNKSTLVEWADDSGLHRGFVPSDSIALDPDSGRALSFVAIDDLAMALPYGLPWADIVELVISMKEMEQHLYKAGIWTADDVRENPLVALAAIGKAYSANIRSLLEAAELVETAV